MESEQGVCDQEVPTSSGFSKKFMKRLKKAEANLTVKEHLEITSSPTKIVCVQNGGLGNDVSQDDLYPLFSPIGQVEGIVMVPRKPYCFVCFAETTSASRAMGFLNGHILKGGQDPSTMVILYLFYVQRAPSTVMPSQEMPPGLVVLEEFVSEDLEKDIQNFVDTQFDQAACSGQMKHRQVVHFGYEFKYGINDVDINDPLSETIPELCHGFLTRAKEQGAVNHFPDQLTVNQYKAGQGIPPHVDTPAAFEDGIMSLSLGSQAVMEFRHPDGRHLSVLLPRRSLMIMSGDSRYMWSHGITPRKSDIIADPDGSGLTLAQRSTRTSLTFRKVVRDRQDQKKKIEGVLLPQLDGEAVVLEKEHVQQVYDDIADHFSGTRYKPWPRVIEFILEQPEFSLLADVGCGNGKCLGSNKTFYEIGSDFSKNLAGICHSRGFETCVGDVTCLPFRAASMDVVLCIAVIHHLATKERRVRAIQEVVKILKWGGHALIYVWAMEQDLQEKPSKYIHVNRQNCLSTGSVEQKQQGSTQKLTTEGSGDSSQSECLCSSSSENMAAKLDGLEDEETSLSKRVANSELHACKKGDYNHTSENEKPLEEEHTNVKSVKTGVCEENVRSVSKLSIRKKTKSKDTSSSEVESLCDSSDSLSHERVKLHVHVNRTQFKEQDMLVPWQLSKSKDKKSGEGQIFHRFYHVFRQGELEALCKRVPDCAVVKSYYDQGNWCVVLKKL